MAPSEGDFPLFLLTPLFFISSLTTNKQHHRLHVRGDKRCSEPVGLALKPKIRLIRVEVKTSLSDGGEGAGIETAAGRCRDEMGFLPQRMQSDAIPGNYKQARKRPTLSREFSHLKLQSLSVFAIPRMSPCADAALPGASPGPEPITALPLV